MHDTAREHLATIDVDGRRFDVSLVTEWDGVEYVGRLWFADEAWEDAGFPDRGALPGRTKEDVMRMARQLRPEDLARRYQRALTEKRRFHALRRVTDDMLSKIRYLNQVALSVNAGLLDADGAAHEMRLVEEQLHAIVSQLGTVAAREE